jgi:hypothetical protein
VLQELPMEFAVEARRSWSASPSKEASVRRKLMN